MWRVLFYITKSDLNHMRNSSLTTKHCASTAAHWLQGAKAIFAPAMGGFWVSGSFFKYGPNDFSPNTGLEIDRMAEVRG